MNSHLLSFCLLICSLQLLGNDGYLFTENKGQWPDQVAFQAEIPGGKLYFENDKWTYYLYKLPHGHGEPKDPATDYTAHVFSFNLVDANPAPSIRGSYKQKQYKNYFLGNDPEKWAGGCGVFEKIDYKNVYQDIDLKVYNHSTGLKYDFVVAPNADPNEIKLRYDDLNRVHMRDGKLVLEHRYGFIEEQEPYAYQFKDGVLCEVECEFVLKGNETSFEIGDYDPDFQLVIDPQLVFSTFTGSSSDNWGYTATYDREGNAYGGGAVFGTGYPTSTGAFDDNFSAGSTDIGISKFSKDGTQLLYSTYIGGDDSDLVHSIIVNNKNELVVFGTTGSSNFPVTASGYDSTFNGGGSGGFGGSGIEVTGAITFTAGSDIAIAVLSADGTSLVGSTFFGGSANDGLNTTGPESLQFNYGDHARGEVIIDGSNNIYIGSVTGSNNIPGTSGSFQSSRGGNMDGVVAKFNADLSNLIWASYVGGNDDDCVNSLKLDNSGNLFATGGTASIDFETASGFDDSYNGGQADGYLLKIANNGSSLLAGTFLGTNKYDQSYFVEVADDDRVYVVGQSLGSYVATAGVYKNIGSKQFVHAFDNNLSATEFSTVIGSGNSNTLIDFSPTAFLVDFCDRIYVSGWGGSANVSYNGAETGAGTNYLSNMPITGNAYKGDTDGTDLYFISLEAEAAELIYGSYFGGSAGEHVDGGTSRFDKDGKIYQAVCAGCGGNNNFTTFPNPGVWSNENGSDNCNLGVIRFNFEPDLIRVDANFTPSLVGCAPYTIEFTDDSNRGETYLWDFGDGTTSTEKDPPPVTYTVPGNYTVSLIVEDPSACNLIDSTKLDVFIPDYTQEVVATFEADVPGLCEGKTVSFTNTSDLRDPDDDYIWSWDHGDGTDPIFLVQDHDYTYDDPGFYTVELIITHRECLDADTVSFDLEILEHPLVAAELDGSTTKPSCIDETINFSAVQNAQDYFWIMDDGSIVNGPTTSGSYSSAGEYTIELVAIDNSTCNMQDTLSYTFEVFDPPVPGFVLLTPHACTGEILALENQSVAPHELTYEWTVDGQIVSADDNPSFSVDQAGTVSVCVTSTDVITECSDFACEDIEVKDFNLLMPTAFSPNGDDVNDVLSAFGTEVEEIHITLFDRWGNEVFNSDKNNSGWNGKTNGQDEEMSVYAYILEGVNSCGSEITQYGNVTLIR